MTPPPRSVLSLADNGEEAVMGHDFYRCPNTGLWVYRWCDERITAVLPRWDEQESAS